MLDHLSGKRASHGSRTAIGLAVSVAVHALLVAVLVYGIGLAGRAERETAWTGAPAGDAAGGEAVSGAGGGEGGGGGAQGQTDTPTEPGLDLTTAELGPRLQARLPDTMELGRPHPLRLVLPPSRIATDSLLSVRTGGDAEPLALRLTRARGVALSGTALIVDPLTPPLQLLDSAQTTEWRWSVTPTRAGTQSMSLRLDAVAEVDGRTQVVTLGRTRADVVVHATTLQRVSAFFARHWTWMVLIALAALFLWGRGLLRARRAA